MILSAKESFHIIM